MRIPRRLVLSGLASLTAGAAGAPRAWARAGAPAETEFALRLVNQKIFVPVRINGVEATGFLDTGVSSMVVDSAFAATAGIKPARQTLLTGWGIDQGVDEADNVTLELPGIGVSGASAVIMPLVDLRRTIGEPFDVIVGRNLFDNFAVELDFDQARVRISSRKGFKPPKPSLALGLKPSGGQLAAPVRVEGHKLWAAVDLGASMPLSVPAAIADRMGLLTGRPVSDQPATGVGGMQVCPVTMSRSIGIGPYSPPAPPAVVFQDLNHQAVLGLPVFSRFRVWLDYGGRRMFLAPGASYWAPFDKNRVGLYTQVQSDGLAWVTHVSKGSPAEKAGFAVGDRLRRPGTGATSGMRVVRDPQITPGATLRYEMEDGAVRTLLAADYY